MVKREEEQLTVRREIVFQTKDKQCWFLVLVPSSNRVSVTFKLYESLSNSLTEMEFMKKGAATSLDCTSNAEEAAVYSEGWVKWDGCSDLDITSGSEQSYHIHLCGRSGWKAFFEAMERCFEESVAYMKALGTNVEED